MLLSICIPTYNRGPLLCVLVRSVLENISPGLLSITEIVISDNHSTDQTGKLLSADFGSDPRVRIVKPERHLPTAEESLCFAVSQCQGEFVWSLGDDDAVERQTLVTLEQLLKAGNHDFLIFNSRSVSYRGLLKNRVQVLCRQRRLDMPLLDFVRISGFWYILAGFSMFVFRRSMASTEEFLHILQIGRIYSHVIWMISCFHDKRFAFVNEPLINYRENTYVTEETNHWEKVSEREKIFDGGLWSTGFLRLVDHLVARGIIERSFVRDVVDRSPLQRNYLADDILYHFLRGLRKDIVDKRGAIPESEISYFLDWAHIFWGNNIVLLSLLDEVARVKREGRNVRHDVTIEIKNIVENRSSMRWFEHFHLYDTYGYSVFRHGNTWFAIRLGGYAEASNLLEILDFDDWQDLLCARASEAEVLKWIEKQWHLASASATRLPAAPRELANLRTVHLFAPTQTPTDFNARMIANAVRARTHWRFHEWFRLVRALNVIAIRSVWKAVRLRR